MVIQGRRLTEEDLEFIRTLIRDNPSWHRTQLSRHLCSVWKWRAANGQIKDMACRSMLRKLHERGFVELPELRRRSEFRRRPIPDVLHCTDPIVDELNTLLPIQLIETRSDPWYEQLFRCFLARYHYLGYNRPVGETMRYLALDCHQRPLAALLYGSAAWKTKVRDEFIGWNQEQRQKNLNCLTNNSRFLVLPWVKVKSLASHVLAKSLHRLSDDWKYRYSHPIYLVKTFVDQSRFFGTCYQAANWNYIGQTVGRTRQDTHHRIQAPIKDVYVYGLSHNFRDELCQRR